MKLAKTAALAKVALLGIVVSCLAVQAICDGLQDQSLRYNLAAGRTTQSRPKLEKQETAAQLVELYNVVRAFIHDRNSAQFVKARGEARHAKMIWAKLPQAIKEQLEIKHPGSAELLEDLDGQLLTTQPASKPAPVSTLAPNQATRPNPQPAPSASDATDPAAVAPAIATNASSAAPATMPCQVNVTSILGIPLDETASTQQ
jgi:hypothetical protein